MSEDEHFLPPHGNYAEMLSFQKAEIVYDLTFRFAHKFLTKGDCTIDQMIQAARSGKKQSRAALAGITDQTFEIAPYQEILNKEAEIIGVSDHLAQELPLLIEWVRRGKLKLSEVISRTVPLQASAINEALDRLEQFREEGRVVIVP